MEHIKLNGSVAYITCFSITIGAHLVGKLSVLGPTEASLAAPPSILIRIGKSHLSGL
jgi:hypothetical protein